jgi:hypothetical protein
MRVAVSGSIDLLRCLVHERREPERWGSAAAVGWGVGRRPQRRAAHACLLPFRPRLNTTAPHGRVVLRRWRLPYVSSSATPAQFLRIKINKKTCDALGLP